MVRTGDGLATVCVCDDGSGIPENERDAFFEAYQQGRTDTPVSGSMGLGVKVSQQLATLMRGELTCRHEGGISVFALTLPLAAAMTSLPDWSACPQSEPPLTVWQYMAYGLALVTLSLSCRSFCVRANACSRGPRRT